MFYQSYEQLAFNQQVIALNQTYPCPRCSSGKLEPFGYTETFHCDSCERSFVPLRGSRLLYPSKQLGLKIAPIFWWDGQHWHLASTTATTKQILFTILFLIAPILLLNLAIDCNVFKCQPHWCDTLWLKIIVGFASMQLIYLTCWDFNLLSRSRVKPKSEHTIEEH